MRDYNSAEYKHGLTPEQMHIRERYLKFQQELAPLLKEPLDSTVWINLIASMRNAVDLAKFSEKVVESHQLSDGRWQIVLEHEDQNAPDYLPIIITNSRYETFKKTGKLVL